MQPHDHSAVEREGERQVLQYIGSRRKKAAAADQTKTEKTNGRRNMNRILRPKIRVSQPGFFYA